MELGQKKVEYLELIYDLVFVYVIGRNNGILHNIQNGFVPGLTFYAYALCTLAIIQIWNFSTYYINMHGRNGVRDHVFLLINMYLLYFIAEATRLDWQGYQTQYHLAWGLILVNIGVQYLIERRNHADCPDVQAQTVAMACTLFAEALIVFLSIPVYRKTGFILAPFAIAVGVVGTSLSAKPIRAVMVNFEHLSERAMLYVVFTFGEMIIALSNYFTGAVTPNLVYFSLLSFLIVVGLFLSYGLLYDRIIDREMHTNGIGYMVIHIFLIFALNNITASLEFMREPEVALLPKVLFITGSLVLFYIFLFATAPYAKEQRKNQRRFLVTVISLTVIFAALMLLLRENMWLNIAVSAAYVYAIFLMIYHFSKYVRCVQHHKAEE